MSIEVKVPMLPESVEDATIASWHRKAGDSVRRDDNLVDLETDKVVLEVPAPVDGVLKEIKADEGATVLSGQLLAVIEEGPVEPDLPKAAETTAAPPKAVTAPPTEAAAGQSPARSPDSTSDRLSPAVRRVIEEEKIDPASIPGSGRGGRVTKGDVLSFTPGRAGKNDALAQPHRRAYEGGAEHCGHPDFFQ